MNVADFSRIGRSNVRRSKAQERQVAKLLSEWTGETFRRRRTEGRDHATVAVDLCADVIPVDGPFLFSVEAKTGAGFRFESLLTNPRNCLFTGWWHQTCYDAQLISRTLARTLHPLLFFRPTPQATWVGVSVWAFPQLRPRGEPPERVLPVCWFPHLRYDAYEFLGPIEGDISHGRHKKGTKKVKKLVGLRLDPVILCPWKDFAANVDPASATV